MIPDRIEVNIAGGLDIALPRMLTVRQKFEAERLTDIAGTIALRVSASRGAGPREARTGRRGRLRQPRHRQHRRDRQGVIRELQALGAQALHLPVHGQPRRGHRRRPEEGPGELRHHRSDHRRADPGDHGHGRRRPPRRRHARAHGPLRRRGRRRSWSSTASSRIPRSAARPRAASPRCCPSASARSSAPAPTTRTAWTCSPSCCRRSATSTCARATCCSAWASSRTPTTRRR